MHDLYHSSSDILSLSRGSAAIPILDRTVPIVCDCANTHPPPGEFAELVLHFECLVCTIAALSDFPIGSVCKTCWLG